jgi:general secretion pathway protein M
MNGRSLFERRLIALGLLALLLAALWLVVIAPIARGFAERAVQREQLTDDLLRGRRLIASGGLWRDLALRQRGEADRFAVVAPNASAAAQQATDRISAAIQTPGGVLISLREQPAAPGEARLKVEGRLTLTQLVASLKLIEGQKPFVIIEGLSVAADPTAASGQLSPMDVRIDLAVPYLVASR